MKINLLPDDLAVNKRIVSATKTFRSLTVLLLIVFLAIGIGLASFFVLSSIELKSLESDSLKLTTQIKSQQETEQKITLLKDRLSKIKSVASIDSADKKLLGIIPVVTQLPSDSTLGELSIDSQKVDLSLTFRSLLSLNNFFTSLSQFEGFKTIKLNNFGYNPSTGYLVGLRFTQ